MIKLGFVSAILADQTFEQVISFANETGYSCVEIMCWPVGKAERRYAGITHIDVAKLTNKRIKEICNLLEQYGVGISGLGYYPNPLEADTKNAARYVAHLKKVIDAAAKLGLQNVNTFIGRDHRGSIEDNFKRFRKVWPGIIKHAEKRGIKIGIENCPMFFTDDEWPGGKNLASSPAICRRTSLRDWHAQKESAGYPTTRPSKWRAARNVSIPAIWLTLMFARSAPIRCGTLNRTCKAPASAWPWWTAASALTATFIR